MKLLILLCVFFHITSLNGGFVASEENDQSEKDFPLHEAVLDDDLIKVKKLINKGGDKNAKNNFGRRPLHLAAQRGFEDIVKLLIESNAEIDTKDNYGKIPLHFAAQYGHFEIFKLLIKESEIRSIDFKNVTDDMGMSVLHYAAMNRKPKNTEILSILIQKGANVNSTASDDTTALDYAASTGNPEMVRLLLDGGAGASVNFKDSIGDTSIIYAAYGMGEDRQKVYQLLMKNNADINNVNEHGETALFFIANFGGDDEKLADFLIKKGARVNDRNNKGDTPLHHAAKSGHTKLGECFIKNRAKIDASNDESQTPLHYAAKYGQDEFVELLINRGSNAKLTDENRNTALHLAVKEAIGHVKILELLSKGEDINSFSKDGKSLLHLNVEEGGDIKTFKWLLDKGANINAIDKDGNTLLHSAARHGRIDILEWIMHHTPPDGIINKQNTQGNSPLHEAVSGGFYDFTEILLNNGADVNAMNYNFEFPIHFASSGGYEDIINLLIKYHATVNVKNRINRTPLYYSVLNSNDEAVKVLVNHKNEDFRLNDTDAQGKSVLHICAEEGSVSVAKILTSHGSNISAIDKFGQTPLHRAAANGNLEFVDWLINSQSNADSQKKLVNVIDNDGKTPLHLAAENGYEPVVRTLLLKNSNMNVQDKSNNTALSLAVLNGYRNVAKTLLKHSNTPHVKYANKRELLLLAAEKGYDEIVELLINKNAKVTAEDENKWTPLHFASKNGHINIARTLLSHGAQVDAKADNNQTAVFLAYQNGHYDIVDELLINKADISIPNDDEKTLLDVAMQQNNVVTVDLLSKHEKKREEEARIFHIFIFVIFMLLFPLVIYITLFFHKICRKESTDEDAGLTLTDLLERYMFPQSQLMLCSKIGKGNFGPVYKGYAHKIQPHENETLVAIKTVKGSENSTSLAETQKMLLSLGSELKILMICGGHLNLVNLLGIVAENIASHELMVIVEYCQYGHLKDVLEKHHKNVKNQSTDSNTMQIQKSKTAGFATVKVTRKNLASWSYQIAQGMQHLASHNIVHGNLAARAILLADGNVAKISDFGLARALHQTDKYIREKEGKLEYKWLAIESMQNRVLTSKSDVWSFGIVLWELFSFGETPYQDIEIYQLKRAILSGYTLEKPANANDTVYEIMQNCWRPNPESRPSFDSLEKWLYQLL